MSESVWLWFVGGLIAAVTCIVWTRRLAGRGQAETFRALVAQNLRDLAVPFAVVSCGYIVLAYLVGQTDNDDTTIARLRELDGHIQTLRRVGRALKLGQGGAIVALLGFALGGFYLRYRRWSRAARGLQLGYSFFDRYQKLTRTVTVVATTLSSYTFFSAQSGRLVGELELHAKVVDAVYREFVGRVAVAIEEVVSTETTARIRERAPATYRDAETIWKADVAARQRIVDEYPRLSSRYRFSFAPAEELTAAVGESARRIETLAELFALPAITGEAEVGTRRAPTADELPQTAPPEASLAEIRLQRAQVGMAREAAVQETLQVFDGPGKKIIPGLLGLLLDPKGVETIARLAAELPLFGPMLEVFSGAVTKYSGNRVTARARLLAESCIRRGRAPDRNEILESGRDVAWDLSVNWDVATNVGADRVATTMARAQANTREVRIGLTAASERARPVAESMIRKENARLAEELRVRWPVAETGHFKPVLPDHRIFDGILGRHASRTWSPPTPTVGADRFIADASLSNDLWKENEVLHAAAKTLSSDSSEVARLQQLAEVTTHYMPNSAAAAEVTFELGKARLAVETAGRPTGGLVEGRTSGDPFIARRPTERYVPHESFHPRPSPRTFFRR